MISRVARKAGTGFLLLFFAATLAAPHHHLNPIADLVTDGPSDSGRVLLTEGTAPGEGFAAVRLVDDDACLACFWHDVTASASTSFTLQVAARILFIASAPPPADPLQAFLAQPVSRGPPSSLSQ